jgi:nucleoside-diphosphate-sugar epimerase
VRIVVLGGTRFIGRFIVRELTASGHDLLVVHRGRTSARPVGTERYLHVDREALSSARQAFTRFRPQACVDTHAMSAGDALAAVDAIPDCERIVALSSSDVYRAYASFLDGDVTDPVPITEDAPLRDCRLRFRERVPGRTDYEKLDVERVWLGHGATILRLCAVYGPGDYLRREAPIIDRIAAGRRLIPFGPGNLLYSRISAQEVARCVRAVVESRPPWRGEVFNVCEPQAVTAECWAREIARALGHEIELVSVPDDQLPADLAFSRQYRQHMLLSCDKALSRLPWRLHSRKAMLEASVHWHAAQPVPKRTFDDEDSLLAAYA